MSDGPLSPEEVAHRGFATSFRGFDTGEVRAYLQRVANDLRAATARERDLHRRLTEAEHRAAHPVLEGEALTRALGDEMGRILASAQEAANGLRDKAEENAARVLKDAHDQAQRIRAQAEGILAVRTEEADVAAAEIRRSATAEATGVVRRASVEAAAAAAEVEAQARQLVQDAQAARARVLGDLTRRRRLLQTQVEQLRAGRERLLDAYRKVRSTTDEVADELRRVEDEAREAAGAAAERAAAAPVIDDLDDVLAAFAAASADVGEVGDVGELGAAAPAAGPAGHGVDGGPAGDGGQRGAAAGSAPGDPGRASTTDGAARAGVGAAPAPPVPGTSVGSTEPLPPVPAATGASPGPAAGVRIGGADEAAAGGIDPPPKIVSTRPGGERRGLRLLRRPKEAPPLDVVAVSAAEERVRVLRSEPMPPTVDRAGPSGEQPPQPPATPVSTPTPTGRVGDPTPPVVPPAAGPTPAPAAPAPVAADPPPAPTASAPVATDPSPVPDKGLVADPSPAPAPVAPGPDAPAPPSESVVARAVADEPGNGPVGEAGSAGPAGLSEASGGAGAVAGVEELFARIRAGRADAVARAHEVLAADPGAPVQAGPAVPGDGSGAATGPDRDPAGEADSEADGQADRERLLRRRDLAVGGIEPRLARKLKRALQDEQNEVLDRLRSAKAGVAADAVLSDREAQVTRYRLAAEEAVRESAAAGIAFVVPVDEGRPPLPDVAGLVAELADALAEPLRRALERALQGDGADPLAVAERIGAAYRECKAQRIEGLVGDAVTAAFSRGALAALPAGRAAHWVVDDDGRPCPDCDDNALAGPTPVGEAFPTGQSHPPAHAGCRCLLAPTGLTAALPGAG